MDNPLSKEILQILGLDFFATPQHNWLHEHRFLQIWMQHYRLNSLATQAAIIVAGVLIIGKFAAWWLTNSLSIQASLIDSLLDMGASVINFFAIKHASRPPDKEHRFGYGKLEAIASLGQSIFIAASALWLMLDCMTRLYRPEVVERSSIGSWVMGFAVLLTLALVLFQRFVYKRTHSLAIRSDSLHYETDLLTNAAVFLSLHVSTLWKVPLLDIFVGGGIAIYIAVTSSKIFKRALSELMDRELDEETLDKIQHTVMQHPDVLGMHDLRTRASGHTQFIQMHLELNPNISLLKAHKVAVEATLLLRPLFPNAEILIHQDPKGHDEEV